MKLYKGRIPGDPNPLMDLINRSLPFDIRLLPFDVATNKAWARQLNKLGVFTDAEYQSVLQRLDEILAMHETGAFDPLPDDEDIHTLVERLLTEKLGGVGARIHTGRSRNDQVVTDLRQYTAAALGELSQDLLALIDVIRQKGEAYAETLLAGTTHLQPALPITLGHYLYSLGFALVRDHDRLLDTLKRVNLCPLGAGAMAGSGFPVNRDELAEDLGFTGVLPNSVDAVSDRDFCTETAMTCSILVTHLSRYAEQMIIWANPAFAYVRFSDQWSTGSSMMPQKRNPDAMELIRGKAARVQGAVTTLSCLTKGLPLSYAKDLQEDKEPLFDVLDTAVLVVRVFREALSSAVFYPEMLQAALTGDMLATDLADALARAGVPFRKAHEMVGSLVSELESAGRGMLTVTREELIERYPEFNGNPPELSFQASVEARNVAGGTAPQSVRAQAEALKQYLAAHSAL